MKPLDFESLTLARREREILGEGQAVMLYTCPRCGWRTLVWSGQVEGRWQCVNRRCGLDYASLDDLLKHEEIVSARKEKEIKELMRAPAYQRVRGAMKQTRY
ncbi:MAG: hypothetical protein HPY52_10690 [Firmicutes bacterium]|nr:hypothetical protein [Bacillota bacterium]